MSPIAEAERIMRRLVHELSGQGLSIGLKTTDNGAAVVMNGQVVHIRPDWSMSLARINETPLDWIPLDSKSACLWLRGEK